MRDIWNEISYWLSSCKDRNVLEKEYENTIIQCLGLLGWKKYLGEITRQYPVQVGHETKVADIVISLDGIEQIVIEVKRPEHIIHPEDERQLVSYMRLLTHPVPFGLYIGHDIRLYYDNGKSFPEMVFCIDISSNNSDGEKFIELFCKNTFDRGKLKAYCDEVINNRMMSKALETELSIICSDNGERILKNLLSEHLKQNGFDQKLVDERVKNIRISISQSSLKPLNEDSVSVNENDQRDTSKIPKRHRSYIFNGTVCHKPAESAFLIVQKIVDDNPTLTFEEIRRKLSKSTRLLTEEEYSIKKELSTDSNFERRWFYKSGAKVCSSDNVNFMVQTGWSYWGYNDSRPSNICTLIDSAREHGYDIQEL